MKNTNINTPSKNFLIFKDLPHSEMVYIPAGTFIMGNDKSEYGDEKPEHKVYIQNPFWIGKYPVTQAVWKRVVKENPSKFRGDNRPVEQVSWNDIKTKFLPQLTQITGKNFTLPSEAQWEYAALGGEKYEYAGSNILEEVGWFEKNSHRETMPVGLKNPNGFGLYDMSGNVWEWCEDDWNSDYKAKKDYTESPWIDSPRASSRVLRGGDYFDNSENCRVSNRSDYSPHNRYGIIGCRLAVFQSVA